MESSTIRPSQIHGAVTSVVNARGIVTTHAAYSVDYRFFPVCLRRSCDLKHLKLPGQPEPRLTQAEESSTTVLLLPQCNIRKERIDHGSQCSGRRVIPVYTHLQAVYIPKGREMERGRDRERQRELRTRRITQSHIHTHGLPKVESHHVIVESNHSI